MSEPTTKAQVVAALRAMREKYREDYSSGAMIFHFDKVTDLASRLTEPSEAQLAVEWREKMQTAWEELDLGADCDADGLRWTIRHLRGCIDQPCREAHDPTGFMCDWGSAHSPPIDGYRLGAEGAAQVYRAMERARVGQEPPSEGGEG